VRELGARAHWLVVYIAEAHATDEWPINSSRFNGNRGPVNIAQTKTLEARIEMAQKFAVDYGFNMNDIALKQEEGSVVGSINVQVVVDDPEQGEPFLKEFAPWPIRLFVFQRDSNKGNISKNGSGGGGSGGARMKFASSPRGGGFIDLIPFADAMRLAVSTPLSNYQ
jgi:hypothetical protein